MITFDKKKKTFIADNTKRGVIAQGGVSLVVLFAVILVLASNFSFASKRDASESVNKRILENNASCASELNYHFTGMTNAGQAAAAMICEEEEDLAEWMKYAKLIKGSIPTPYMVVIVDMNGQGVSSEGTKVNLQGMNYYMDTRTQKYIMTENDGILNKSAFISIIPFYREREEIGMIYMYQTTDELDKLLPVNDFDGNSSYAIIDGKGKILTTVGKETCFLEGYDLFSNLEKSVMSDLTLENINKWMNKQAEFICTAQKDGESKSLAFTPMVLATGIWLRY